MKMTAKEYGRRVRHAGPSSALGRDCLWAFCTGGSICLLGELLRRRFLAAGLEAELAGTLTSCSLILLSAVLTTLGWYQKLAARAGAGTPALPTLWSAPPLNSRPRAGCRVPGQRCFFWQDR